MESKFPSVNDLVGSLEAIESQNLVTAFVHLMVHLENLGDKEMREEVLESKDNLRSFITKFREYLKEPDLNLDLTEDEFKICIRSINKLLKVCPDLDSNENSYDFHVITNKLWECYFVIRDHTETIDNATEA